MEPTIYDGEYVLIKDKTPTYGDIVVVNATYYSDGETFSNRIIKRVIAMEGDTIILDGGLLYIKYAGTDDFIKVEETYINPECNTNLVYNTFPTSEYGNLDKEGHVVEDGCMFLLGDNRDVSLDSRNKYGDVSINSLIGVVTSWSLKNKKSLTSWCEFWNVKVPAFFG